MKTRLILTFTICALLFVGCNTNGGDDSISVPDTSIVGRWEMQSTSGVNVFIEFRENATFITNLNVYDLSQDDGIYTIEEGILRLYYVSRNEVNAQTNSPIQGNPTSDSIYLYKTIDNKLYLAMWIGYDPDRDIDDIIDVKDENLLHFDRVEI